MKYEVESARPRGRPKRTCREVVKKDCQARGSIKAKLVVYYCKKKLNSLKHLGRLWLNHTTKTADIKRRYYLAAHRRVVNVLTSNTAFLIFAVLLVCFSHSHPYRMF